jgi:hypothetical protein
MLLMKRIWKWTKLLLALMYGIMIFLFVIALLFTTFATLTNKELLVNTETVNRIALLMGLISLPGAMISLFSMFDFKSKKYTVTTHCPNCKHNIDLKLVED